MSSFEEKIANFYGWSIDLTNTIIFEYERFLQIKSLIQPLRKLSDAIKRISFIEIRGFVNIAAFI